MVCMRGKHGVASCVVGALSALMIAASPSWAASSVAPSTTAPGGVVPPPVNVPAPPLRDVSPAAVAARSKSQMAYVGQSADDAVATIKDELPALVGTPAWQPLGLPEGLSVASFDDDDRVALVTDSAGKSLALSSTSPLRAVDSDTGLLAPIDLRLVLTVDGFQPVNSATPIALPRTLGTPIAVGRFQIGFPGASQTPGTPVGDTVVWPNALTDTDVVAQPTTTGLELSLALRSTRAPEDVKLQVTLPAGATLRSAAPVGTDGPGLEVVDDKGAVMGTIAAPVAWDADHTAVPTSWQLDGQTPVLHVDALDRDLAWPIAVDPGVNDNRYGADLAARPWAYIPMANGDINPFYGDGGWGPGMYQRLTVSHYYGGGDYIWWELNLAGRAASVRQLAAQNMNHDTQATCTWESLWDDVYTPTASGPTWCETYRNYATNAGSYQTAQHDGNMARIGIFTNGAGWRSYFQQSVGTLVAALEDDNNPTNQAISQASATWNTTTSLTASAYDAGLGVKTFNFTAPGLSWAASTTAPTCQTDVLCNASGASPPAPVTGLPDGKNQVVVDAVDPAGNSANSGGVPAGAKTTVAFDRSAPVIGSLSGTLYDNRATSFADTRAIRIPLTGEGSVASPADRRSGVKRIRLIIDNGTATTVIADQKDYPQQDSWVPDSATGENILRIDGSALPAGTHTVNVDVGDWAGNTRLASQFTITTKADTIAPVVSTGGGLSEAATGYLINDGSPYSLTLDAADDETGIKSYVVKWDGGSVVTANVDCSQPPAGSGPCPNEDDRDLQVFASTSSLPEGAHTVEVLATDSAGNVGSSGVWTVYVDKTAPSAATALNAMEDTTPGSTYVQWDGDLDPAFADGTPGSDVVRWTYRQRRNGGAWSAVQSTDWPGYTSSAATAGDTINVQVTSYDASGNVGPTADISTQVPATTSSLAAPGAGDIGCEGTSATDDAYRKVQLLSNYAGYANIAISAQASVTCHTINGAPPYMMALSRAQLKVCIALRQTDGSYNDLKCGAPHFGKTTVRAGALELCRSGTQTYAVHLILKSGSGKQITQNYQQTDKSSALGCNGANAWRRVATRNGRPNALLGANLPTGASPPLGSSGLDIDTVPAHGTTDPQRGWEAHHIIPAQDSKSAAVQAVGYACDIPPNGAVNGVWLRGRNLKSSKSAYGNLTASERKRAYHGETFGTEYRSWITTRLAGFVNPDGTCKSTGHADAVAALRTLRADQVNGQTGP